MAPSEDQRREFGRRLRELRIQRSEFGSSQALADHLRATTATRQPERP